MKNIKKLLSIVMVLTLVLALGAQAFAATVKIEPATDGGTHSYVAYQIFKGDNQAENNGAIGNLDWGKDIDSAKFLAALQADATIGGYFEKAENAQDVAKALKTLLANELDVFAKIAQANVIEGTTGTALAEGETELEIGYYVIVDTAELNGVENAVHNRAVLQVTQNVTVKFKADKPSSEKKVKDVNDSTGEETDWQDSADYDIGDKVPFQLKATIPAYTTSPYDTYELVFHDVESDGLTFDPLDVKVTVNGVEAVEGKDFTVNWNPGHGDTFDIIFKDIKTVDGFTPDDSGDDEIIVEYTSTLNENAVIGATGNPNEMYLEYSNDIYSDSTGKTPDDKVIVFTYDLDVNKIDGKAQPLEGAEFALYKEVPAGTPGAVQLTKDGKEYTGTDGEELFNEKYYVARDLDLKGESKTTFYSKGLDDGNYVLFETVTPAGYNTIDPVEFTVTATHDTLADDPQLKSLNGTDTFSFFLEPEDDGEAVIDTNITNLSGVQLPSTGGIGTTIFYVVGGVLVAAAVILLVTKRRVSEK